LWSLCEQISGEDDEAGIVEYARVRSDRDCRSVVSLLCTAVTGKAQFPLRGLAANLAAKVRDSKFATFSRNFGFTSRFAARCFNLDMSRTRDWRRVLRTCSRTFSCRTPGSSSGNWKRTRLRTKDFLLLYPVTYLIFAYISMVL